jgi:hypothetical protein
MFVAASSAGLDLRVPLARCSVRGLPPIYAACTLTCGRLPTAIWVEMLDCLRLAHAAGYEVLVGVRHDGEAYRLVIPGQVVAPLAVRYAPQEDLVLEVHSHRDGLARFSATDSADEQRLRLYGVVGRLDRDRPQVALRAGAYGHFLPIAWDSVFNADPAMVEDAFDGGSNAVSREQPFGHWESGR